MMRIPAAILKAVAGVFLTFLGLICCFRSQFPHYRTAEISPEAGFREEWMSDREVWMGVLLGITLLALSGYLLWSAHRSFRHARIAG